MFRTSEEAEAFRKLLSDRLGVVFSPRKPKSNFFVNIEAFPKEFISESKLLFGIKECLNALGIRMNDNYLNVERGGLVWVKMMKGEEVFSLGVRNSLCRGCFHIIITATPL